MLTRTAVIAAALLGACSLDPTSKPICVADYDCGSSDHCVSNTCVADVLTIPSPDVLYVVGNPTRLEGDVIANDVDPDGDEIHIKSVRGADVGTSYLAPIMIAGPRTVALDVPARLPATYGYLVDDSPYSASPAYVPITVARLPTLLRVPVARGLGASLSTAFSELVDARPETVELVSPPTLGTLTGAVPDAVYTPPPGYCGKQFATYRVHAANGTFDVPLELEVGVVLVGEQRTIGFGAARQVAVLDNELVAGLEIIGVDSTYATITATGDALVVDPPAGVAGTYTIRYTARDAQGCTGSATLTLDVEFPTQVLIGDGISGDSFDPAISNEGRYVAFTSADPTLVVGDTNGAADVFVLDAETGTIERVSVGPGGVQANEASGGPAISADGRWVAFSSRATNLASEDTTAVEDVYLHDRVTHATVLVSVSIDGAGSDQPSTTPHLSSDGRRVVFASTATRLVSGDSNGVMDVFVRDLVAGTTMRVSVTNGGEQVAFASQLRPRINANGRYVALISTSSLDGSGKTGTFLVDTLGNASSWAGQHYGAVDIDDSGRFIAMSDDASTVRVLDRVVGVTTALGYGVFPSLSADGRYAAFAGLTSVNPKQVLAWNRTTTVDVLVNGAGATVAATPLRRPEISGDGRWIVFATSEWPGQAGHYVIVRVWNRSQD